MPMSINPGFLIYVLEIVYFFLHMSQGHHPPMFIPFSTCIRVSLDELARTGEDEVPTVLLKAGCICVWVAY